MTTQILIIIFSIIAGLALLVMLIRLFPIQPFQYLSNRHPIGFWWWLKYGFTYEFTVWAKIKWLLIIILIAVAGIWISYTVGNFSL